MKATIWYYTHCSSWQFSSLETRERPQTINTIYNRSVSKQGKGKIETWCPVVTPLEVKLKNINMFSLFLGYIQKFQVICL